ncbi:LAME_0E00628g1_1 [Lachancea meyersii CBS 8951]|uniref:LAME_0E00628g1_1 n=1 Tax=Lachancea meyersii CBS 8951 TaxID=1266667 RepID=A0A1G4JEU4_9SACH|nr:LAME_0E00628g1_1 [Lachancea meyersii CBS 8951]
MKDSILNGDSAGFRKKSHSFKASDPSSTFDDGLFEKLQEVLSGIDLINETASNDYRPILAFFSSRFAPQLTQAWSYHAQVNNHAKFTNCTSKLARALRVLGSDPSTLACGSSLIRTILLENVKVLYRGLNNMKPATTNSVLRLMREMVAFNSGEHVDDFLTYFDLALPSVLRILAPTRAELADLDHCKANPDLSMRYNFMNFWLTLIENSSPLLRKAVLTENSRIMSGWFKHMTKVDSVKLMKHCVSTMSEKVLRESSLKKATKCKILNEAFISRLHHFYYSGDASLVKAVDQFFELYSTSEEHSVAFSDDKLWFSEPVYAKSASGSLSNGAMVMINNKKFYLYNKILYTMLTFFKPWEDESQLNRVIQVLQALPELVAPYCSYLETLGHHEPKMTSYWFGMTLLLGRIINLPIPQKILDVQTDNIPLPPIVLESIAPCPLTKAALSKALQHEVPLIKQMGCQLLIFCFQKLEHIFELYEDKGWNSAKSELVGRLKSTLPDLSVIATTLDFVSRHKSENKILAASVSLVLNHYSKFFPLSFNLTLPSDNIYSKVIKSKSFSGLDLVILDSFLQFQELNNSQAKWYNPTATENSTFTTLLKLASSSNATASLTNKVASLLDSLLKFTVVFDEALIASPILALINSLQVMARSDLEDNSLKEERIWKLLDETISRCMKTPYKYVDNSAAYGHCSPFLVALTEQWHFMDHRDDCEKPQKWLIIFLRSAAFIGEPLDGIRALLKSLPSISESLLDTFFDFENYDMSLNSLRDTQNLVINDVDFSFFQHITLTPALDLDAVARYPINRFDVAGLIQRLRLLLNGNNTSITHSKFSAIVDNLLAKVASYALSQAEFRVQFTEARFFGKFMVNEKIDPSNSVACERYAYVSNTIADIYSQLNQSMPDFQHYIHSLWLTCAISWEKNDALASVLLKGLAFLSPNQLQEVLHLLPSDSQKLLPYVVKELLHQKIQINNDQFMNLLSQDSALLIPVLQAFIKFQLIEAPRFAEIIPLALRLTSYKPIIEEILQCTEGVNVLSEFVDKIKDDGLVIKIAASVTSANSKLDPSFIEKALSVAFENLTSLEDTDLDAAIKLFVSHFNEIPELRKNKIVEIITTRSGSRFTPQVPNFIALQKVEGDKIIRSWMQKCVLFITKNIVEKSQPTARFSEFLANFLKLHEKINFWKHGMTSSLNSQIQAIVGGNWISYLGILKYLNAVLLGAEKSQLNTSRMLQLLLNNDQMCFNSGSKDAHIRFLTTSCMFILFNVDAAGCSSVIVQEKLLLCYGGTICPSDRMILNMLEQIESKTISSWTNNIFAWDYQDVTEDQEESGAADYQMIVQEAEGFIITIQRKLVKFTAENFAVTMPALPITDCTNSSQIKQDFIDLKEETDLLYSESQYKIYDPMFLLLSMVNNEELFKNNSDAKNGSNEVSFFEMKRIIDSGLLELVLVCLSFNGEIGEIALLLVHKMLESLDIGNFKDKQAYKLLLMKIACTFHLYEKNDAADTDKVPPLIWSTVARVSTVLSQPSSFLYERAYRWVLSSPSVNSRHIPFYDTVVAKKDDDGEHYYKYLHWFLESILQGLKTDEDLHLLRSRNVFEWVMNLLNSPYITLKLRVLAVSFLYKSQRLEGGGPTLLTRFAGTSFLESMNIGTAQQLVTSNDQLSTNTKNKLHLMQNLVLQQSQVNYSELGAGFTAIAKSRKRLVDWVEGDGDNFLKRMCLPE